MTIVLVAIVCHFAENNLKLTLEKHVFSWNVFPLLQHQKNEEKTLISSPQNDDVLMENVKTIGQTINKENKLFIHIGCHIYITNVLNKLETYNSYMHNVMKCWEDGICKEQLVFHWTMMILGIKNATSRFSKIIKAIF